MLGSLTRRTASGLLGAALCCGGPGPTHAGAQQLHPAACVTSAQPGDHWTSFAFAALRLQLALPAGLLRTAEPKLRKTAERAAERNIPSSEGSEELVAAWEAPGKAPGAVRQVLLFTVLGEPIHTGRPCALLIAQQPGFVFKLVLSGQGGAASEYWTVARWPGFVLALGGRSLDSYEEGFAILRSVAPSP